MKLYVIYCMTTYSVIRHFYHPFVLYSIKRATKSVYRLKDGGFRPLIWKINEIAIGILRKNSNVAQDYKNLEQRYKLISDAVNHTKEQLLIVKSYLNKEKSENIYKFFPQNYHNDKQPSDNKSIASVIADALMCDEAALPAVGRLHMHTDWVFLTEAEKKALIKKMEEAELQM